MQEAVHREARELALIRAQPLPIHPSIRPPPLAHSRSRPPSSRRTRAGPRATAGAIDDRVRHSPFRVHAPVALDSARRLVAFERSIARVAESLPGRMAESGGGASGADDGMAVGSLTGFPLRLGGQDDKWAGRSVRTFRRFGKLIF